MKVLIADDDPTTRHMLCSLAEKWGYEPTQAGDGYSAWANLRSPKPPRVVILDWQMPGLDGPSLCRELRLRHASSLPYTYVIFLTARQDKRDVVTALDAGADDYLVKPFDSRELEARLRAGRRIIELQDELLEAKDQIERLSLTDPVTETLNRRGIMAELARRLADAMIDATPLCALLIDFDRFKRINDLLGHAAGDAALRAAAKRLQATIHPPGAVGRFGGDEFLVIFPQTPPGEAIIAADAVLETVAQTELNTHEACPALSASGGLATWDRSETLDGLLARADAALYQAKAAGRSRLAVAQQAHNQTPLVKGNRK